MGFRGGGVKLTPPQRILVFKYPSRDRVKIDQVQVNGVINLFKIVKKKYFFPLLKKFWTFRFLNHPTLDRPVQPIFLNLAVHYIKKSHQTEFYYYIIQLLLGKMVSFYTAQLLCYLFIRLFKVIT